MVTVTAALTGSRADVWLSNGGNTLLCSGVCVRVCVEEHAKESLALDLITHFLKEESEPALVPAFK